MRKFEKKLNINSNYKKCMFSKKYLQFVITHTKKDTKKLRFLYIVD